MAKSTAKRSANGPKRPRDPNQLAHQLIRESTEKYEGEPTKPKPTELEISRVMAELGRRGGRIGGKKRMDTLTQERRSQIAFKAAQARWKKTKKP